MWQAAIEIVQRVGGDPGMSGLSGPSAPPAAVQPAQPIVMESEGHAMLNDACAFEAILRQLRDAGVEILRRGDHPLVEAFEESAADAKAITNQICAFENLSAMRRLLEQYRLRLLQRKTVRQHMDARRTTLARWMLENLQSVSVWPGPGGRPFSPASIARRTRALALASAMGRDAAWAYSGAAPSRSGSLAAEPRICARTLSATRTAFPARSAARISR